MPRNLKARLDSLEAAADRLPIPAADPVSAAPADPWEPVWYRLDAFSKGYGWYDVWPGTAPETVERNHGWEHEARRVFEALEKEGRGFTPEEEARRPFVEAELARLNAMCGVDLAAFEAWIPLAAEALERGGPPEDVPRFEPEPVGAGSRGYHLLGSLGGTIIRAANAVDPSALAECCERSRGLRVAEVIGRTCSCASRRWLVFDAPALSLYRLGEWLYVADALAHVCRWGPRKYERTSAV